MKYLRRRLTTACTGARGGNFIWMASNPARPVMPDVRRLVPELSMRRKRLQHVANILCQMFCGWRLINSKPNLVKLGSGTLSIDALTGNCYFNQQPIEQLSIAVELREWLKEELLTNRIPFESLSRANVKAELTLIEIPWSSRTTNDQFFDKGKHVKTERMHRCIIECESEVTTDEVDYRSSYKDIEEWPVGWPAV